MVIIPTGMSQFQPFLSGGIGFLNANGAGKLRVGSVTVEDRRAPSATEFAGRVDGGVDYFFTRYGSDAPKLASFRFLR